MGNVCIDRVRAENVTMSERVDRALRSNALFVLLLVLVLSIAVLVLVLDRSLRYRFSLLDQPSQHRHDPFQIGFANPIQFGIYRLERNEHIVNCSAFQSRTTSDLEKSILVFQALLPITLGNVEWNRLGRSQPLITSVAFRTIERFRDSVRRSDIFDRKSIDVKSFVVKDRLCHLRPFEYEYEYRFTEYEYEEIRSDSAVWQQPWVVNSQAVGDGRQSLKYLAPYVFRVAIGNHRIARVEVNADGTGKVTFMVKPSKQRNYRTMTVTAEEFIRRLLQHVLPPNS
jgi:Putative transposase